MNVLLSDFGTYFKAKLQIKFIPFAFVIKKKQWIHEKQLCLQTSSVIQRMRYECVAMTVLDDDWFQLWIEIKMKKKITFKLVTLVCTYR